MRNIDKYKALIKLIWESGRLAVNKNTNLPCRCRHTRCEKCLFHNNCKEPTKFAWLLEEYKEPILDEAEKSYLENVSRPYKDRIVSITKLWFEGNKDDELMVIRVKYYGNSNLIDTIHLPCFKVNTMYKNMEKNKKYTPKELGLFEGEK